MHINYEEYMNNSYYSIGNNQIGAEGVKAIGEALKSNSTLSELDISKYSYAYQL